ncbi:cytochrome P450 [Vibrio sp. vnigr-6D03]|nr:cytochrome P450 [Vibrio sp. vnigr-6D03]
MRHRISRCAQTDKRQLAEIMSIIARLKAWASNNVPLIFSILRFVQPNVLYKNYALITRFKDVQEALSRPNELGVTYADKMRVITDGSNFFLGMDDIPDYTRDVSNMRLAVRRDDLDKIVAPLTDRLAKQIMENSTGRIELVSELTSVVPCQFTAEYLGVSGIEPEKLFNWTCNLFQYLFYPDCPKEIEEAAIRDAASLRGHIDHLIEERRMLPASERDQKDDILERCLKLQESGTPGMTDYDIRNNLIGIIIGLVPTTSKCAILVLDYLLDNKALFTKAQRAAHLDDMHTLEQFVLETLRFKSFGAGLFRIANCDYTIAQGTWRSKKIKKGTQVFVATQSAMLDGRDLSHPKSFKLDRPRHVYMHFGYGMHTCFGQYINLIQIPNILKAILKSEHILRAEGERGLVQYREPYPISLTITHEQLSRHTDETSPDTTIEKPSKVA